VSAVALADVDEWNSRATDAITVNGITPGYWNSIAWATCDVCTGASAGRSFSWHMENDTDITAGTPCGCANSGGDTDPDLLSAAEISSTQKSDGTYSLYIAGANDYAEFSSQEETFNPADGTVTFDVFLTRAGYDNSTHFWQEYYDDDNRVFMYMNSSTSSSSAIDVALAYRLSETSYYCTVEDADKDPGETGGKWYRVTGKWDTSPSGSAELYAQICDLNTGTGETSNCVSTTQSTGPASAIAEPSKRFVGNKTTNTGSFYIDNFHLTKGDSGL